MQRNTGAPVPIPKPMATLADRTSEEGRVIEYRYRTFAGFHIDVDIDDDIDVDNDVDIDIGAGERTLNVVKNSTASSLGTLGMISRHPHRRTHPMTFTLV
jgi:hypothetical protein